MDLRKYNNAGFNRGASLAKQACWLVTGGVLMSSWLPGSGWRRSVLRLFGAKIGTDVVIKPGVRVKFPWRLSVGDYSWIGEDVWIDNLAEVCIGRHVCVSQGVYICTGSHDWSRQTFDLIVKPVVLSDHAWACAFSKLGPGAIMEEGSVLAMGCLGSGNLSAWSIHSNSLNNIVKPRPRAPENQGGQKHG